MEDSMSPPGRYDRSHVAHHEVILYEDPHRIFDDEGSMLRLLRPGTRSGWERGHRAYSSSGRSKPSEE